MENLDLNEEEFKLCLQLHGYISSNEDSCSDSDFDFDEICKSYNPPAIEIDLHLYKIIEIGPGDEGPDKNSPKLKGDFYNLDNCQSRQGVPTSKSQTKKKKKRKQTQNTTVGNTVTDSDKTDSQSPERRSSLSLLSSNNFEGLENNNITDEENSENYKPYTYADALKNPSKPKLDVQIKNNKQEIKRVPVKQKKRTRMKKAKSMNTILHLFSL